MSALVWLLVVVSQLGLIMGQILLKRGMARNEQGLSQWKRSLAAGIASMTVWFLLWLGLMHVMDLSQLMPLEGLSPMMIAIGGVWFFGERISLGGWLGIGLTCVGVVLVSLS